MAKPTLSLTDTIAAFQSNFNVLTNNVGDPAQLTTTVDSDIVGAINELDSDVGSLGSLLTDDKASIVSAINELVLTISVVDSDLNLAFEQSLATLRDSIDNTLVGHLADLNTTDKTTVVDAINELDRRLVDVYNSSGTLLNT